MEGNETRSARRGESGPSDPAESDTAASDREAADGRDASASDPAGETGPTRRGFVRAAGGAGAVAVGGIRPVQDDGGTQVTSYRFGGEVLGWYGREPAAIAEAKNPTLTLQAGTEYEVTWINLDGQPHNFTLQDDAGNNLAASREVSEEGAEVTFTFTATPEMTTYVCTIHPTTMVGDLVVEGGQAPAEPQGWQPPEGVELVVLSVVVAFLSPLAFALFLLARRGGGEAEPAGVEGDD